MNSDIRFIFLDLGGTFRVIDEDPAYRQTLRRSDQRPESVVRRRHRTPL